VLRPADRPEFLRAIQLSVCRRAWSSTTSAVATKPRIQTMGVESGAVALDQGGGAEYGPRGVNVNELAPGPVRTPGTDVMGEGFDEVIPTVPVSRPAAPEEIAAAAVYLAREAADSSTAPR
jgi:enoyl-[acyl-carrier-protein] reductase (NADH)